MTASTDGSVNRLPATWADLPVDAEVPNEAASASLCQSCPMPWNPELFSAPALEHIRSRRERLIAVPYFAGLIAGETDALIKSFVACTTAPGH
jgi:hypothetical protein